MIDVEVVIAPDKRIALYEALRGEPGVYVGVPSANAKGLAIRASQTVIDKLDQRFGQDIFLRKLN